MLTRVLLKYFARTAAVVLLIAGAIVYFTMGEAVAGAMLASAVLVALDGAALIWVVGELIDPRGSVASKALVSLVLMAKLAAVGGLLYWLFAVKGLDQVGLAMGIVVGMLGLVIGVNRGSKSEEGRRAIAETEREIAQEMEDNEDDSL